MTSTPPGLLIVWTNIPEELEYDFNDWYNRVHMPERIQAQGGNPDAPAARFRAVYTIHLPPGTDAHR